MLFSICYDLALAIFFLAQLPFLLRRVSTKSKHWMGIKARFLGPWPKRATKKAVWVHAVSLGESKAVFSIIEKLKADPKARIICTVQSDTGYEFLSKIPDIEVYYAPLDISWVQKKFIERINPELLLLSEGDLWYHQIKLAKEYGAKVILISGKLSEKSTKIYKKLPWITRKFFAIDAIGAQNALHYERFASILEDPSIVSITGNLKYAQTPTYSYQKEDLQKLLKITGEDFPITIASTHECEEEGIIETIEKILKEIPSAKIFLAPRHPSRFYPFYKRLQESLTAQVVLFSSLQVHKEGFRVCLIDQMGILSDLFRLSKMAILAGSFDPSIGGHNLIEPLQAGCPVLFGPYVQNQIEFKEAILNSHAGWQRSLEEIPSFMKEIQANPSTYRTVLENGAKLIQEHTQIKDKSWQLIKEQGISKAKLLVL